VAFADRTYVLANGELVTTLAPKDHSDTERLIAAYLGRTRA
jgi:ABC-type branched-subunit amino acid transport system ATPase component